MVSPLRFAQLQPIASLLSSFARQRLEASNPHLPSLRRDDSCIWAICYPGVHLDRFPTHAEACSVAALLEAVGVSWAGFRRERGKREREGAGWDGCVSGGAVLGGGRGGRIRTDDIQVPNLALYQTELLPGEGQDLSTID